MEGVAMLASEVQKAAKVWPSISEILFVPHTKREYQAMVDLLDNLVDEVGEDEKHPLASLMEIVGVLVEKYEDEHVPELTEQ
jgi:HTH-type transcriptional regulator/antitoxin HigA